LQDFFELADTLRPVACEAQVEILGGAGRACEAQLHRHAPFEVVDVNHAAFHRLLQYATECEKRDPSPQPFLVEALFARDAGQSFFQTFCGLCGHAVTCAF
jgi:hypothetical protein